jgi:hypothetical protein
VTDRDWLWSDYAREDDPAYTPDDIAWLELMEQVDRDQAAGMYDEENAA